MRIVYHSYEGRYSDNPRALYETLLRHGGEAHEHVWLMLPRHGDQVTGPAAVLPYGSPEAIEALESADVVVANTHTDVDWRKRAGATYLQTWHGTPLKRIHWDVLWAPEGRLDRLQSRDVDQWDVLVSANAFSTGALRRAFRWTGEVLETGYPRNDVLLAPGHEERRAEVRRSLGLADGETAVLYTPTWRDEFVFAGGDGHVELELDLEAFVARFGDSHRLLLRLHRMLSDRLGPIPEHAVLDVSAHPEVSDLYLAADVLVTDYSSTMFDFALTGRPMVFFAYDLDDYRDRQRGFYFDFEAEAPGPIVRTSDALLDALGRLDEVAAEHAGAFAAFRERYGAWEDGHASERVLERLGLISPSRA